MPELDELIEACEIDVKCWQCGLQQARTLSWLSTQRHMACPSCTSVIVLDTSDVRREIARQRRQLSALRDQMTKLFEDTGNVSRRVTRTPTGKAKLDLALARSHPDTVVAGMRRAAAGRRLPR